MQHLEIISSLSSAIKSTLNVYSEEDKLKVLDMLVNTVTELSGSLNWVIGNNGYVKSYVYDGIRRNDPIYTVLLKIESNLKVRLSVNGHLSKLLNSLNMLFVDTNGVHDTFEPKTSLAGINGVPVPFESLPPGMLALYTMFVFYSELEEELGI